MKTITNTSFEIAINSLVEHEDSSSSNPVMVGKLRGEDFAIYCEDMGEVFIETLGTYIKGAWVQYTLTAEMVKRFWEKLYDLSNEKENEQKEYEYEDEYFTNGVDRSDFY